MIPGIGRSVSKLESFVALIEHFKEKAKMPKTVVLSVRNRTDLCVFAHFFAPPKIIFSLIISVLLFWHDFCSIINI